MEKLSVSVVIPTYKRGPFLIDILKRLVNQGYKPTEIIIIDQTDYYPQGVWDNLEKYLSLPYVCYRKQKEANAQKARNKGIELSNGEVVLFLDDDVILESDFIDKHIKNYDDPKINGVVGMVLSESKVYTNTLPKRFSHPKYGWLYFSRNYSKKVEIIGVWSNNLSLRREVFNKNICFDDNFSGSSFREDSDFALEMWHKGFQIIYAPECWIIERNIPYGGMREGKRDRYIQPLSYMRSECYFILKNFGADCWFPLLWSAYRRFVLFKYALKNPFLFAKLNLKWMRSLTQAGKLAYGIRKKHKGKYPFLITPYTQIENKSRNRTPFLMIADNFPPVSGGISRITENVYKYAKNFNPVVLTTFNKERKIEEFNGRIIQFPMEKRGSILINFGFFLYALLAARRYRAKCILCSNFREGYIGMIGGRVLKIPIAVFVYGNEIIDSFADHPFWSKLLLKKTSLFITDSLFTHQRVIKQGVPKNRVKALFPGVPTVEIYDEADSFEIKRKYNLKNKKVILTVARLVSNKGIDTITKAIAKLSLKIDNIAYLVVGRGPDEGRLRNLVEELKIEDKVIFCGFVPDEELPSYYKACDVFAMISRVEYNELGEEHFEGFGISFIEAAAAGKPSIGGICGGTGDAVVDKETGLLVSSFSIEEVESALFNLLTNPPLAVHLGKKARERVAKMTWPIYVENLERLLKDIVED